MTVYVCKESMEGILCGVYDAWMSKKGHENVRLQLDGCFEQELFAEYRDLQLDNRKVSSVITAIRRKIGEEAYEKVYISALSQDTDRADKIYRFLIYGFKFGKRVMNMLQIPEVFEVFQMCRNVYNENHLLTGFVRFSEIEKTGFLFSKIAPKNAVLPLLATHFAERLSCEKWLIYDSGRRQAAVYYPSAGWALFQIEDREAEEWEKWQNVQGEFEKLWKIFYKTIGIKERENKVCQRTHLPLRFRGYMTEFEGEGGIDCLAEYTVQAPEG